MKIWIATSVLAILLLAACNNNRQNEPETTAEVNIENVVKINLNVEGMTCGGCENSVEKKLGKMGGVVSVEASHTNKTVVIEADTAITGMDALKKGIADAGYTVVK